MATLPAPVQRSRSGHVARQIAEAAYRDYERRYGSGQSLDDLLRRGGFAWSELVVHLYSELVRATSSTKTLDARDDLVSEDGT